MKMLTVDYFTDICLYNDIKNWTDHVDRMTEEELCFFFNNNDCCSSGNKLTVNNSIGFERDHQHNLSNMWNCLKIFWEWRILVSSFIMAL